MKTAFLLPAVAALTMVGCAGMSNQTSGTIGGAAIGGGLGAIAGNNIKGISKTEGAIGGAVIGGLLGNTMGRQQDQINQLNYRTSQAPPPGYYPPPPPPGYRGY